VQPADLLVGMEDLDRPRAKGKAVETEGEHEVQVVEQLENQVRRKQLAQPARTSLVDLGRSDMAGDEAEARHDDRLQQRKKARPERNGCLLEHTTPAP
jgi:hypothetical protein